MLKSLFKFSVTNQKGPDIPLLCKTITLGPCTSWRSLFGTCPKAALHRHKYSYFSEFNCDVVQLLLCLYPGNLKKNLIDANKGTPMMWSQMKDEADIIVSTLKEAGQS